MAVWRRGTKRFVGNDGRLYLVTAYPSREHTSEHESPYAPIDGPPDYRTSGGQRVIERDGTYVIEGSSVVAHAPRGLSARPRPPSADCGASWRCYTAAMRIMLPLALAGHTLIAVVMLVNAAWCLTWPERWRWWFVAVSLAVALFNAGVVVSRVVG